MSPEEHAGDGEEGDECAGGEPKDFCKQTSSETATGAATVVALQE